MALIIGEPKTGYVIVYGFKSDKEDQDSTGIFRTLEEAILNFYGSDYNDRHWREFDLEEDWDDMLDSIKDMAKGKKYKNLDDKLKSFKDEKLTHKDMLDVFQAIYGEPIEKGGKIKIPLSSKQYLLLKGTPFAVYQHLQSGKAEDSFYTK